MNIQKVREAFERRQARNIPMSYEEFKQRTDEYEEITGRRYGKHSVNEREWIVWLDAWQARAQAVPEGFVLVPKCLYCNGYGEVGCRFEGTFTCPECNGDRINLKAVIEPQEST